MGIRDSVDRSSSETVGVSLSTTNGSLHGGGASYPGGTSFQNISAKDDILHAIDGVLHSDIAVNTLLSRLKQSIASAREFAAFLKKRSTLEEEHAQGLKKLCKGSLESTRRPDNRQGSYSQSYCEVIGIHDKMADNGVQFALSLHQMHEDLHDLAGAIERGRKTWKQTGLNAEKRVQDAESMMEKAKLKYDTLVEDYDRARTGDKQSGRVFGIKGPKSAAQHEEDLHKKVQAADSDLSAKVQSAQIQRQELVSSLRPQAVKAIQDLINECDSGLSLQLQKFASFNERLLLGNGLCVSPLKGQNDGSMARTLREVIHQIDNKTDFQNYLFSFASKIGSKPSEIKMEHQTILSPSHQTPYINDIQPQPSINAQPSYLPGESSETIPSNSISNQTSAQDSHSSLPNLGSNIRQSDVSLPQDHSILAAANTSQGPPTQTSSNVYPQSSTLTGGFPGDSLSADLPPVMPVFGVSLDDLLRRDGSAIPLVVYQCLQAVDLFGLEVEGIYRLSGSSVHVTKLRNVFDNDSNQVDFRNPENFYHDVNSVAGLLKQFFRDLPDPLLTREHYQDFIKAARIDDDIIRRDSLHATINSLPDTNYATLRALTLHLNRVQEHSNVNRMNAGNLAICFGPTLMGSNTGSNIADAGWQVRVIDTILQNTYQIFDDD